MGVRIDDEAGLMTCDLTEHVAKRAAISWRVTWLHCDTRISRTAAITAMTLAEAVHVAMPNAVQLPDMPELSAWEAEQLLGDRWPHIKNWAGELGLDGAEAVSWVLQPRRWQP